MQLRFASFVVINLRRDLHPQECAHAGRTMKKASKYHYLEAFRLSTGADYRIRTDDLPLTRRLLYQMS